MEVAGLLLQPHHSPDELTALEQAWPAAYHLEDFTEDVLKLLGMYLFPLIVTVSLGSSLSVHTVAPFDGSADTTETE